ncbi:MICAL-like protein isoform X3 [Rhodnius prolixus]
MGERRGTKALETWCRRVTQGYPGVKVENMTTSWRDGLAFCAMIHHFRPDLIDFSRLDKSDIYGNNELAFRIAERHLGIPALLDAEDMAEYPVPDRLSILTYLSQFYQAFASNSSSPIKKPSSDSPEDSLVSLVQGNVQQSTKMEEGSSLPRREPCVICNNPVFIAQKLRIDGKLYHRTCFRCARCGNQLSLADYYETHDGQYCCETCPDEIIMETSTATSFNPKLPEEEEEEEEPLREVPQLGADLIEEEDFIKQKSLYDSKMIIKALPPEPPPSSMTPSKVVNKDPSTTDLILASSTAAEAPSTADRPSASLVAIRRMMFDSYNIDTDDAKLIINKKDLSHNNLIDSSSHNVKSSSDDKKMVIVNSNIKKNNINIKKSSNNTKNNSNICNNEDEVEDDIINNSKKKLKLNENIKDTHQFSEILISKKTDISNNIVVDCVNRQLLVDNMYKTENIDKSLPLFSKYSDTTTQLDSVQVSSMSDDQLTQQQEQEDVQVVEEEETKSEEKEVVSDLAQKDTNILLKNEVEEGKESLALHTEDVIDEKNNEENETKPGLEVKPNTDTTEIPIVVTTTTSTVEYPEDLNPFGNDDEEEEEVDKVKDETMESPRKSTNPFGSDSEDEEEEGLIDQQKNKSKNNTPDNTPSKNINQNVSAMHKSPSLNPFDSDEEDDDDVNKPVPFPRKNVLSPEPVPFPRNRLRGSLRSINSLSSTCSLPSPRKKKPAPLPPSSPSSTLSRSPRARKTKRAPLPPASSTLSLESSVSATTTGSESLAKDISADDDKKQQDEVDKEEIAKEISNIVGLISDMAVETKQDQEIESTVAEKHPVVVEPIIEIVNKDTIEAIDKTELRRESKELETNSQQVVIEPSPPIRRNSTQCDERLAIIANTIIKDAGPRSLNESVGDISYGSLSYGSDNSASLNNSYYESLSSPPTEKRNKDSVNMHRKISESGSVYLPKSSHGQWRRKKAPAPPLPLPKRRPVQPMPIQNIRQELHDIEIKQQGLERQGVALENKIRDKFDSESSITPYVEELVLQLFELVNEKNELFRKQAELMYLRRQQHLEEEHSELEYQIRCLMARPEANKTDSDKELEEQLIQRLVEVVERRDAIVQCLEMDRLREAEEDRSINTQLGIFTLAMAKEVKLTSSTTKKKHKKTKDKQNVMKMMDLDKDVDDSEKESKKKKKWFTLHHIKGKHL